MSIWAWDQPKGYEVGVGICHRELCTVEWALHFKNLQLPSHIFVLSSHMPIDLARNSIADSLLNYGCKWILMLDTDLYPPENGVMRLLSHNLPIVSGLYYRSSPPTPLWR